MKMPANDVTVTGSFVPNIYAVVYIVDGVEYKVDSIVFGSAIVVADAPTKEGYTFSGWSDIPQTMPAQDVTVTGTFRINKYQVTYVIDGEVYATDSVEYGASIVLPVVEEKEGYTFSGWSEVPQTMPANNVTIYGSFTTGIEQIRMEDSDDYTIYNIGGYRTGVLQKGFNIVRDANGKVSKIYYVRPK